jgi:hypothetical protein
MLDKFIAREAPNGEPIRVIVGDSLGKQVDPTRFAAATGQLWFNSPSAAPRWTRTGS